MSKNSTVTKAPTKRVVRDWTEALGVIESKIVGAHGNLAVYVGMNRDRNGQLNVFIAKVTETGFVRTFCPIPLSLLPRIVEALQSYKERAGELEKEAMIKEAAKYLRTLAQYGISLKDIERLIKSK